MDLSMKNLLSGLVSAAGIASFMVSSVMADVVYSGLTDIPIPTNFDGIYINLDNGAAGSVNLPGADINPFFGGQGIAFSSTFLAVRTGTQSDDPILAMGLGVRVDGSLPYSSDGSNGYFGSASGQFTAGQQAYLGFKFNTDAGAGPYFGWMRVVFTQNTAGGLIKDWAYDTSGGATRTGNILQSAAFGGVSTVTLSSAAGETTTLGSVLSDQSGGVVTSLQKTGAGTWKVNSAQSYTGGTVVAANGGTLEVGGGAGGKLSGTTSIAINTAGTLLLSGAGGANAKLNPNASVTLAGGTVSLAGMTTSLDQAVGALTLSASSVLDFGNLSSGNTWRFSASNGDWSSLSLNIYNYSPGADHLFFGTNTSGLNASQLDRIAFYGDTGSTYLGYARFSGETGEISAAIPEPTSILTAFALLTLIGLREGRQRARRQIG